MSGQKARGYRNNNPLNIRKNGIKWQHQIIPGTDSQFCQFDKMTYGIRAAFRIFRTYIVTYRLTTLSGFISRWAPPKENDTRAYIAYVSKHSGIAESDKLDWHNEVQMHYLLRAMASFENGYDDLSDLEIYLGYHHAL